jgi:hypothetical protein
MKRQAYTMIAMLVLVGSMAVAAQAQTNGRTEMRASIPFEFNVGDKTMPAGEYTISQINPSSDHAVLQLRSKDGRNNAMIQMNNVIGKASEGTRLVFNRYGSESYFAEAWTSSEANGLQAPRSKAERGARQELAGMKPSWETVALRMR